MYAMSEIGVFFSFPPFSTTVSDRIITNNNILFVGRRAAGENVHVQDLSAARRRQDEWFAEYRFPISRASRIPRAQRSTLTRISTHVYIYTCSIFFSTNSGADERRRELRKRQKNTGGAGGGERNDLEHSTAP